MEAQIVLCPESLLTKMAMMSFFFRVAQHVISETRLGPSGIVANVAHEIAHLCVYDEVSLQVSSLPHDSLPTIRTLVEFLVSSAFMKRQFLYYVEHLRAVRAAEVPNHVTLHVVIQMTLLFETFGANGAFERTFVRVNDGMLLHVPSSLEFFPTSWTWQ